MILVALAACLSTAATESQPVVLPATGAPLHPSEARFEGPAAVLADTQACRSCHRRQHSQWSRSAHSHSSLDNPWYLASLEAVRADAGFKASRHCAGCHDPVLLASGAMDGPISPTSPNAAAGVTCLVCHGMVEAGVGGNASYRVDVTDLPNPKTEVAAHSARMRNPALRNQTACATCHRGFLTTETGNTHFVPGLDDWGRWQGSGWAGSDSRRLDPAPERSTCVDCHMGWDLDHSVPGGRTAMAGKGLAAMQKGLKRSVDVWIPAGRVNGVQQVFSEGFAPPAGAEIVLDVAIRNTGVGHAFPGGLADIQDTWVEVEVSGVGTVSRAGNLRSLLLDAEGVPELLHRPNRIALAAFDHTIPPGEAQLIRVALSAPGGPLEVTARVKHRPHREELAAAACAVTQRGTLDGCAESPLTVVATGKIGADLPALTAHALGVSRGLQEELGAGYPSLDAAMGLASTPRERAGLEVLRSRLLGRQGRVKEAIEATDRAAALVGEHPAIHRARGEAYAAVWRWALAAEAFQALAGVTPNDPATWADLARARGSLGQDALALEAATTGLRLNPRSAPLLRSQALALQHLEDPRAEAAMEAWLRHRVPDDATELRAICDATVAECWERIPIPQSRLGP